MVIRKCCRAFKVQQLTKMFLSQHQINQMTIKHAFCFTLSGVAILSLNIPCIVLT